MYSLVGRHTQGRPAGAWSDVDALFVVAPNLNAAIQGVQGTYPGFVVEAANILKKDVGLVFIVDEDEKTPFVKVKV